MKHVPGKDKGLDDVIKKCNATFLESGQKGLTKLCVRYFEEARRLSISVDKKNVTIARLQDGEQ